MQIRDLIPWGRNREATRAEGANDDNPVTHLQRDINRVFEDFWSRFERPFAGTNGGLTGFGPTTDVTETDEAIEVAIELPGLSEKDVEVSLTEDVLTIRGEKKHESEDKRKGVYISERSWGSFYRMVPLPPGVDADKASADFKRGVLTVTLPKTPEAQSKIKRIEVKAA
ncbi:MULTISPECIES: Hsp20/alpha crystallin family protein [unclassified Roseitalea]|uniref:Hsp20/alpha crystallin family protein n=1 Tax=unclassified Roseitalea TaxID=2639107 RepID=UPI00273F2CC8|nr:MULTISPECIES: Hsp20/alpha crystallin family protein [unclassified Roseitalea]